MHHLRSIIVACCLAALLHPAAGLRDATAQIDKGTLWRDAVMTDLAVNFGDSGFHARWRFHRCDCGDLQVMVEQVDPNGVLSGELLMVEGQVLLARGFEASPGDIVSLMQAPSLMLQLVYSLLNRSEPAGPSAIGAKQPWTVKEDKKNFVLNTGFASGLFAAPWSVSGSGWHSGEGRRRFELAFEFSLPGGEPQSDSSTIGFSGTLDYNTQAFPYQDATSLEGWNLQWFARGEDVATPAAQDTTLGDLREQAGR